MNNLPTLKDVWTFLKDYKKIIIGTMLVCMILYALGMTYSIYSTSKIEENDRDLLDESIDSSQEVLSSEKIKELQEGLVSFSFYIESGTAEQFTNYNLMKELLISPETLAYIEESSGRQIEPSPYHAVNMSLEHSTYVLTLSIGTGNTNDNKAIAKAYYDGIVNGKIPFFSTNKTVYMVTQPSIPATTEAIPVNGDSTNAGDDDTSVVTITALAVVVLIGSFVLGVIIALFYSMSRKVITDPFSYEQHENDIVLNLSPLITNNSEEATIKIIEHAVSHPKKNTKLVLSQYPLKENLANNLKNTFLPLSEYGINNSNENNNSYISILNDLTEVNPLLPVEEVVIINEKNKTTKEWYLRQRLLLENYQANVKIIQI